MQRDEIRLELLAQHASLRGLIESVRLSAAQVQCSETKRADLRMALGRLVHSLREHNRHEEQLIGGPSFAAAHPESAREENMGRIHLAEHQELEEAFVDASAVSDASLSSGVLTRILDRLLAHMAYEERSLFCEETGRLAEGTSFADGLPNGN